VDDRTRALINDLRADPEARAAVLGALLGDRFLELPSRMDAVEATLQQLVAAQLRTQEQLDALAQRVDALAQRVDALAQRVEDLAEAQRRTEIAVQTLADRFATHLPRIDTAIGYVVERRYEERAAAYFAPIARRIRVLDRAERDDLVDDAVDDGRLSRSEAQALRMTDTIARGRRDGQPVHLVVEASFTVDEGDVDRAADRAALLQRLVDGPAVPIVAGEYIDEDAARAAEEKGVWRVLDGAVTGPDGLVHI
jgi:polyhydroxyalkanoate synthesis regulator phasin